MRTYRLADPVPDEVAKALEAHDPLTQQILWRRGIGTAEHAIRFLEPSYEEHLHDPALLHDIEPAVQRILKAIKGGERIAIFSDYDCDGIPGGVILHDFFAAIEYEAFSNYIPHRHFEGFGLSIGAVEKLAQQGVTLIITIDCGTNDVEAVKRASELGIDVVITDHHEPGAKLPEAVAVVNPKLGTYPFPHLCGSAVVFKLTQVLLQEGQFEIPAGKEKWWLDMVGIATIADMVPLSGENRVLAHYGLRVLRKSRRPGLQQLLRRQRASQAHLTEDDIGFTIGPRINAASRMDTPDLAFKLLSTKSEDEAGIIVGELEKLNNERKALVAVMTREIHGRLKKLAELPDVLVMGSPEWRPALVGLAANKLSEEYKKPVFLWGRDGQGVIKGSCRSDGQVSVVNLMLAIKEILLEHGGHHFAGGFSVADQHIHSFTQALNDAFVSMGEAAFVHEPITIDATLSLNDLTDGFIRSLATLAPFGMENEKPLLEFKQVVPEKVEQFGKGREHLKLLFQTARGSLEAIAFYKTPEGFTKPPQVGQPLTLLGHLEQSYFMNRLQTRVRIIDIC